MAGIGSYRPAWPHTEQGIERFYIVSTDHHIAVVPGAIGIAFFQMVVDNFVFSDPLQCGHDIYKCN